MSGRLFLAWSLALNLVALVSRPGAAAAQTPVPDAPADGDASLPRVDAPSDDAAPPPGAAPGEVGPARAPVEAPAEAPPEEVDPPPAASAEPPPSSIGGDAPTRATGTSPTRSPPPPPPTHAPTRTSPAREAGAASVDPFASAAAASGGSSATPAPAAAKPANPAKKEGVREATKRRTEEDRKQRFRHGGLIIDARIGGAGCLRAVCQGADGHRAAPGLHLGGFAGFNLFGLIELGIEGGWNNLRPRGIAGRNAMVLYGLDPAQLQQALADNQDLPLPAIDFSTLDVASGTSRAFDVGPSLRIHLLRKGRGLLFVGAGVHYQLWRNRYATAAGSLRADVHGASIPLRVGVGVFIHRNLALMGEVAYAPAIFGAMSLHLPNTTGVVPFKLLEEITGVDVARGLPHFWTVAFTLRFRLGA